MRHGMHQDLEAEQGPLGPRCLATLKPLDAEGLSISAQYDLSGGRFRFPSHINLVRGQVADHRRTTMQRMSISGMQDKISVRLEKMQLVPVEADGTHILKPVPSTALARAADVPANEALTMLLARESGVKTAAAGLVRMQDGELAYVTRRFDRPLRGPKLHQEDFGVLAGMTEATNGQNWKYESSYEQIGKLIGQFCSARERDLHEFFRRVIFNFVSGNGDAHVRNFSVLRAADGFVELSPAYDLLCTRVHLPQDNDTALSVLDEERDGEFSSAYNALGFYSTTDFVTLAERIGVQRAFADQTIAKFTSSEFIDRAVGLIGQSFLSEEACAVYSRTIMERIQKLTASTGPGSTPGNPEGTAGR